MAETVTVVGAGPVGSLLALTLARLGFQVELYERRPDPRAVTGAAGRSINLAVSTRGLHALHEVGLDQEVLQSAVPMRGRMIHSPAGALVMQRYGQGDHEFINSMSRGGLNLLLLQRADESGRVRLHFNHRLSRYDFSQRTATFDDGAGERAISAPVIIGTDGSGSALRAAMEASGAEVSQELLSSGYKELTMPPAAGGFAMDKGALHIWPRGAFMLIALPNLDGSFTCTLFLAFEGEASFARLTSEAAALAFFEQHFPDVLPLIPDLAAQLVSAPLGKMVTVRAWPWSQGSALLLGDASHAIVPFFGQGMNAGFEDVSLLEKLLGSAPRWTEAFARFAERRKPDADAIAELAVENFVEMRDKVKDPQFLFHRAVEAELQRRMPGRYLTRYQLVTFSRVPYSVALQAGRVQAQLLAELCEGVTDPAAIDYPRGVKLAEERLLPLLRQHGAIT